MRLVRIICQIHYLVAVKVLVIVRVLDLTPLLVHGKFVVLDHTLLLKKKIILSVLRISPRFYAY